MYDVAGVIHKETSKSQLSVQTLEQYWGGRRIEPRTSGKRVNIFNHSNNKLLAHIFRRIISDFFKYFPNYEARAQKLNQPKPVGQ